jgi:hypothetical protein
MEERRSHSYGSQSVLSQVGSGEKRWTNKLETNAHRGSNITTANCDLPHIIARLDGMTDQHYSPDVRVKDDQDRDVKVHGPVNQAKFTFWFLEAAPDAKSFDRTFVMQKAARSSFLWHRRLASGLRQHNSTQMLRASRRKPRKVKSMNNHIQRTSVSIAKILGSSLLILACCGCEQSPVPSGTGAAPATSATDGSRLPPPVMPLPAAPADAASQPAPEVIAPAQALPLANPAPAPAAPPASPSPAAAPATLAIRLTTGIALAQTLPDGTGMLCSMNYEWVSGGPQTGVEYVWVIELGDGQRLSGPADVSKRSGTIQPVLRGVRPDRGPFKGTVFAKSRSPGIEPTQLSDFIPLTN